MDDLITIKNSNIKDYYKMLECLGEGTFGQVYRAQCKQTGEDRAIKVIKKTMN